MNWKYGGALYMLLLSYYRQYSWNIENNVPITEYDNKMQINVNILAAKAGVDEAIDFLRKNNIDYNRTLTREELNMIGIE